jgi:hypothetical protein
VECECERERERECSVSEEGRSHWFGKPVGDESAIGERGRMRVRKKMRMMREGDERDERGERGESDQREKMIRRKEEGHFGSDKITVV